MSKIDKHAKRSGAVTVYASAAGLASAVPLPFLGGVLARSARGAAMRRIAKRRGITLSSGARRVLGKEAIGPDPKVRGYRFVRSMVQRVWLPLVAIDRVEDGLASLASALLFERYLILRDVQPGATIDEAEAKRIRRAIDAAVVGGLTDALRGLPSNARSLGGELVDAAKMIDGEGRSRHEAVLDTLLDAVADVPEGLLDTLVERFERALEQDDAR